jgi:hypothetical protein
MARRNCSARNGFAVATRTRHRRYPLLRTSARQPAKPVTGRSTSAGGKPGWRTWFAIRENTPMPSYRIYQNPIGCSHFQRMTSPSYTGTSGSSGTRKDYQEWSIPISTVVLTGDDSGRCRRSRSRPVRDAHSGLAIEYLARAYVLLSNHLSSPFQVGWLCADTRRRRGYAPTAGHRHPASRLVSFGQWPQNSPSPKSAPHCVR